MLQWSDPSREKKCNNIICLVCTTGGKGPYRSTGVAYELVCQLCRHKYIGETSRSAYTLGNEHLRALEQSEQNSAMWRHSCEKHGSNVPGFTMNVTGTFRNDAMLRQLAESVPINQVQQDQLITTASAHGNLYSPQFPSHQEIRELKIQTFSGRRRRGERVRLGRD